MAECALDLTGPVAWLRLGGRHLTAAMAGELSGACAEVDAAAAVRLAVLTGARPGVFVGGTALADEAERAAAAAAVMNLALVRKPTLAVIDGAAHGAELELALACDLRVASDGSTFALSLAGGEMPFLGGTQRLPRVIGRSRALDLLLTGRILTAPEALAWGLALRVVPAERLAEAVQDIASSIASGAPLAIALAKEAVAAAFDLPLAEGMRLEEDLYALLQTTGDRAEGVRAFLERRAPRFRGS